MSKKTLHEKTISACRASNGCRLELATLLIEVQDQEAFGYCASFKEYVNQRLPIGYGEARELVRVGRALKELPRLAEEFNRGGVAWSAVREVVRVAAPETEGDWLDIVSKLNCRDV